MRHQLAQEKFLINSNGASFHIAELGELTMTALTKLNYRSSKYVKTGANTQLSLTQADKVINYLKNSRQIKSRVL